MKTTWRVAALVACLVVVPSGFAVAYAVSAVAADRFTNIVKGFRG